MITQDTLNYFKNWFDVYVRNFDREDKKYRIAIQLKVEHARRVGQETIDIGSSLHFNDNKLCFAETAALFHDIGRFEQFTRYGTFADFKSEDHAQLGLRVLEQNGILKNLSSETRALLTRVITLHNKAEVPLSESKECLLFTRLLRDADKVDIFHVVTEYYKKKEFVRHTSIELDLPDTPEISGQALEDLFAKRIVHASHLKTLNDFKLLQIGWIFDVNFPRTFQILHERKYLEKIVSVLPNTKQVAEVHTLASDFLNKKCAAGIESVA